jgi:uncharacterized protein DUF839
MLGRRLTLAVVTAVALTATSAATAAPPVLDPAGVIALQPGYTYSVVSESCTDQVRSTESGALLPMPEDFDANVTVNAPGGATWLLSAHELTQPRPGDFQGDAGKGACAPGEQSTVDDGDSDGWGSVSRLTLAKDGTTVLDRELITTGIHDLCAGGVTPWNTFLVNEEFPFINDPQLRSGWVWEIDPATGAQKRLTGMGRLSHEQEAYANGAWYLTDDRGDARFVYKFVPDRHRDLTQGSLYGLAFNKATATGTWIGPLNPLDPDTDMRSRGYQPAVWGFVKHEGMVASASSTGVGGAEVTMSESGAGADPGRVWTFQDRGGVVYGSVLVEGDWARLGRPDNLRYNDAGDLFVFEDHSSSDFGRGPTGGVNQIWVLPRKGTGSADLVLFGFSPGGAEATGPWFSSDNRLLYLSIQDEPLPGSPAQSRLLAIRHPGNFNQPYDR